MRKTTQLNFRWGYKWANNDSNLINYYVGLGLLILFLFLLTIFSLNILKLWSWEVGFIDPSTSFAESLIRLYNLVWAFLILILALVLILLGRIIYLFNWNSKIEDNPLLKNLIYLLVATVLNFALIVNDRNLIEKAIFRLNQLNNGSNDLNIWYSNYDSHEFLLVSDLHEYKQLEFIWCILPACVLALIAGPSFSLVFSLDSSVNPEINIKVVGKQWYWVYSFDNVITFDNNQYNVEDTFKSVAFNYDSVMINEDDLKEGTHRLLEVTNRLLIPIGVPIRFLITSTDVLHSWSLPALGLKVDAVPGRLNQFIAEIKRPGMFYGQCSELCGPMHGFMPIVVQAVSFDEYKQWLSTL